jgi:hypothetical protein
MKKTTHHLIAEVHAGVNVLSQLKEIALFGQLKPEMDLSV